MIHPTPVRSRLIGMLILAALGFHLPAAEVRVRREPYRGWTNALILGNGQVEVVIVPEVGRILQFRPAGSPEGVFWENPQLRGKPMPSNPWEASHGSFGGDKTWPAPQSAWNWPPPDVFDATPLDAHINPDQSVQLNSAVSPRFGIRTVRRVVLHPDAPVFRAETTYFKQSGEPVDVSIWIITQMNSPEASFLPIPARTAFPEGLSPQWKPSPDHFSRRSGLVRLTRDPGKAQKIGNDADRIAWVGGDWVVRIDMPRDPSAVYPDEGCSAEIYTNPDPVPYVELETLGPLRRLKPGDRLSATNHYRLERRKLPEANAEARRLLSAPGPGWP